MQGYEKAMNRIIKSELRKRRTEKKSVKSVCTSNLPKKKKQSGRRTKEKR